jgi:hypothetical protein
MNEVKLLICIYLISIFCIVDSTQNFKRKSRNDPVTLVTQLNNVGRCADGNLVALFNTYTRKEKTTRYVNLNPLGYK